MHKLGVSLSFDLLLEKPKEKREIELLKRFGSLQAAFQILKDKDIKYIEIRHISAGKDPKQVHTAVDNIWKSGMLLSIHGALQEDDVQPSFVDPFKEILNLIEHYQEKVCVTIHAFSGADKEIDEYAHKTVDELARWGEWVIQNNYPLEFALEINRKKDKIDPSTQVEKLLDMHRDINCSNIGLCWDFGHYYHNMVKDGTDKQLPVHDFLHKTINTHIYDYEGTTHMPFDETTTMPLKQYIGALKDVGYEGIYNLELDFKRFRQDVDVYDGLMHSIDYLKECL